MTFIGIAENAVKDGSKEKTEPFDFQKLEDLAVETLDISKEILDILKYEDIKKIKEAIEEEHHNLMDIMSIADPNTEFEVYQKWANRIAYYKIEDTLSALHTDIISVESDTNILHKIKDDLNDKINEDSIHTETLTRGVTNYYYSLSIWQALGYSLLFKANDILHGPTANNFYYKLMTSRISEQIARLKNIVDTIDDSGNFIVRDKSPIPLACESNLPLKDIPYVHLGGVEADDDKVITGFTFIRYESSNRLAISIKQGELKELGVIGEENWKDPEQGVSSSDEDLVDYAKFYDSSLEEIYYIDWSFIRADAGRAIVGIKFCLAGSGIGRRVGLCIKTKKVNFAAGQLGQADEWSDAPWKNDGSGEGEFRFDTGGWWVDKDYWQIGGHEFHAYFAEDQRVETNPPAMLTAVGLFSKTSEHINQCYYDSSNLFSGPENTWMKHLAIRATDIFEFDVASLKTCAGEHSSYYREQWDNTHDISCCGEYIYNATAQACIENEYGVKEPHFKGRCTLCHLGL